ncbi:ABC transporter substrate-binding protein [Mariniblastus fucicola]|uniref:NMT1/THI5 like protein n=1 Tax=Mariniblastus fucicola TaxID=980251 RepID=A0A5B9PBS6_9BACT|nr:ABC transporter substrate-binding protein [Mariniblastus fucicola]QEG22372.1 NMT1/THI5 like protein [Mariniblastus fucicola]
MLKFNVAGVPEHFNYPWHLAIESGDFADAGLDVQWTDFPGGTGAMMKSLRRGETDVAVVLTQGAVADILKGNPSRIVKTFVESPLVWGIHVPADSDIESVEQIKGRKYAISREGSGSHLMSIVDAAERGWDSGTPQFEIVGGLDGARKALAAGDAEVFFWEKVTTDPFVENGEFRLVGIRKTIWPAFVICVRESVLEEHADEVRSMLKVLNHHCDELVSYEDAVPRISKRYGLDAHETEMWFSATVWDEGFSMPNRALPIVIQYLNRLGIVDAPMATPDDVWHQL